MTPSDSPFPLDGGRAGDGGAGTRPDRFAREAHAKGAVARARKLRREMTLGERLLGKELRGRGLHVRTQAAIGPYIADFAIHSAGLMIEVDGPHHQHADRVLRDEKRDAWLKAQGYVVLRLTTGEVIKDAPATARQIVSRLPAPPSPTLPPSRGKGEE